LKATIYGCSQDGQDSIDFFGEANFKYQKNIYDEFIKDRELLLYFDALVDSEPVDVKVIQRHKGCVEVSRDLDSNAGFWVSEKSIKFIKVVMKQKRKHYI
jgi:hypothetical protein